VDTVEHTEKVEKEISRMIEKRSRKGEADRDELEPSYMQSVRRYNHQRREENRLAWCDYFSHLAGALRARAEEYDRRAALLTNAEEKTS
jgi:hypothetical protein